MRKWGKQKKNLETRKCFKEIENDKIVQESHSKRGWENLGASGDFSHGCEEGLINASCKVTPHEVRGVQ